MNNNIDGLSNLVNALNAKIEVLQRQIDSFEVVAGDGVTVQKNNLKYVVNSTLGDGSGEGSHPFYLYNDFVDEDKKFPWHVYLGKVNGVIDVVDNYKDVFETKFDDDRVAWIYLEITSFGTYIDKIDVKYKVGDNAPDLSKSLSKNGFPQTLIIMVGVVQGNQVLYQLLKNDIMITPQEVMRINDRGQDDIYYTWDIRYL